MIIDWRRHFRGGKDMWSAVGAEAAAVRRAGPVVDRDVGGGGGRRAGGSAGRRYRPDQAAGSGLDRRAAAGRAGAKPAAGGDSLVALDRQQPDPGIGLLSAVSGLPATTAASLAGRFGPEQLAGMETAVAGLLARVLPLLPARQASRRSSPCRWSETGRAAGLLRQALAALPGPVRPDPGGPR